MLCRFSVEILTVNQILLPQSVALSTVITGRIFTAQQLDREARDNYQLTLTAEDISDSPLSTVIPVTVAILDANDNSPEFMQPSWNFTIRENTNNVYVMDFNVRYAELAV